MYYCTSWKSITDKKSHQELWNSFAPTSKDSKWANKTIHKLCATQTIFVEVEGEGSIGGRGIAERGETNFEVQLD